MTMHVASARRFSPDTVLPFQLRPSITKDSGSSVRFVQDREIYGEGAAAVAFFKVVNGVVRTCKFRREGRRQINAFYVKGDVFGIESGDTYRFSAEAVSDCELISYRRRIVDDLTDDVHARQLFAYAMLNMTRAQDHSLLLGRKSAMDKVITFLLEWAAHSLDAGMITLAMTRQDIADYLGLTIESVSRALSKLQRDNTIEIFSARQIRFKDGSILHYGMTTQ